jgi:hypothetical protein
MELVTIHRAFNPVSAQLIRSRLEAAGLVAFVQHELAALTMEGYSPAAGGILVQVPADQAAEAQAILQADEDSPQ